MSGRFHIADEAAIAGGGATDVYFVRALELLARDGVDPQVVVEVRARTLPGGWPWAMFAGLEEALNLLPAGLGVRALAEGALFQAGEPVLAIEGRYRGFAALETPLLGLLCQASGIATAAARCRVAAGERALLSFGARRMHPAIAPMVERSAWLGGCDGVSTIAAAELLGIEPTGTMPHALVLCLGDTVRAARVFDAAFGGETPTIVLIDTFQDEKFEALRVAEALGERLDGVRFDTPGSRRGDMREILRETRWELDLRGHHGVRFYVSGGLDPEAIVELNPVCDGYGVGTHISAARTIDYSLDIVEIDGRPIAKRGKASGRKSLLVCGSCGARAVVPAARGVDTHRCPGCGAAVRDALQPPPRPYPPVAELRDAARAALSGRTLDSALA
ncbi:MAG TPA: nicotinate phosphoribosyltransferase [Gemmatimonadota bacterium]|nr:nicotinate phosphoribosyltransferase [Gemmatimonadota bacterium]